MPLLWNLFYSCHTCTWSFPHAQEDACIFWGYDYIFLRLVLILPVTSGQDLREGDSWASFTTGWQWCFPLALQLTAQASQVQRVPHWNLKCLVVTGVDDLFFLFFICLDSVVGIQQVCDGSIVSTLSQRPAAFQKKRCSCWSHNTVSLDPCFPGNLTQGQDSA